jgi:hypothetical protein
MLPGQDFGRFLEEVTSKAHIVASAQLSFVCYSWIQDKLKSL